VATSQEVETLKEALREAEEQARGKSEMVAALKSAQEKEKALMQQKMEFLEVQIKESK
jgi:hypothetical protein